MTTDQPVNGPRGLRALVYDALPPGASPVDTACQPISRHVLEHAQGDIVDLTKQRLSEQFGDQAHIVITIRDGDLDPQTDGELTGLLAQTDGGLLIFAVAYDQGLAGPGGTGPAAFNSTGGTTVRDARVDQDCPECGTMDPLEVSRADGPDAAGRTAVVFQCRECDTVWDSYLAP